MSQVLLKRDFRKRSYTFEFGAADEYIEADIDPKLGIKGEVVKIIITLPNWVNTVTAVVSLINADAKEVFADSARNQDDDYSVTLVRNEAIILGQSGEKFKVTLSGVPGGVGEIVGTATVTAYVEG